MRLICAQSECHEYDVDGVWLLHGLFEEKDIAIAVKAVANSMHEYDNGLRLVEGSLKWWYVYPKALGDVTICEFYWDCATIDDIRRGITVAYNSSATKGQKAAIDAAITKINADYLREWEIDNAGELGESDY